MTEDPILRRISDALDDATGRPRSASLPDHLIAPRDGVAKPNKDFQFFINDEPVLAPTPFKKGDKLRSVRKS